MSEKILQFRPPQKEIGDSDRVGNTPVIGLPEGDDNKHWSVEEKVAIRHEIDILPADTVQRPELKPGDLGYSSRTGE